ncbi:hypothetical protein B0H19DRAFT_1195448 [Mycena capillaripes]|nr:hypothetical protein B0H19DRAFT_1195448 [Mycena capillaripes]
MSSTAQPLAPSNPAPANEPSASELAAQVQALTKLVESNLLHSKTATVGSKKKRGPSDENEDPAEPARRSTYRSYGRNLVRTIGPFERIHTIVEHGVTKALADSDDERKRLNFSWGVLKDTIPGFSEEMIGLAGQRKLRKHVCSEVQEGLRGARGDDTNSLKHAIANYVTLPAPAAPEAAEDSDDAPPPPPPPPKFNSNTKVDRGYNNPYSARANTPVKYPATEETYASIRNGEIHVSGTDMPYFMYRDGYVYNSDHREDGLLEGSTMFAASKHIYQGPSVALKQDGYTRGKAGNAALNGVTGVRQK